MNSPLPINLIILSGIVGFALYCLSHALRVWRMRNRAVKKHSDQPVSAGLRFARVMLLGGALICVVAIAGTSLSKRQGELVGDGLIVPRRAEQMQVIGRAPEGPVSAGAVLVRFHDPQQEAQIATLKLHQDALTRQREADATEAPELSPDLARRQNDLSTEEHHLQAMLDQLTPDRDQVLRDQINGRATRLEEANKLDGERAQAEADLAAAQAKLALEQKRSKRLAALARNNAATIEERDDNQVKLQVLSSEVKSLQGQLKNLDTRAQQSRDDADELVKATQQQAGAMKTEIEHLTDRLADVRKDKASLDKLIDADLTQAKTRKQAALQAMDSEIQQASAKAEGLERALTVTAPTDGTVKYSAPSPDSVPKDDPVLVFAPSGGDGFYVRARMPAREARALARAGTIVLEAPDSTIQRRFQGKLLRWTPLPHESEIARVELQCDPPADAVAQLVDDGKLSVRLRWVPPFYTVPAFQVGAVLLLMGLLGQMLLGRSSRRSKEVQPAPASPVPPRIEVPLASKRGIPRPVAMMSVNGNGHRNGNGHGNGNGRAQENSKELRPVMVPGAK